MKEYFNNLKYFLGKQKEHRPEVHRSYFIIHIIDLLLSLLSFVMQVMLPAAVVATVIKGRAFWQILVFLLIYAAIQVFLNYFEPIVFLRDVILKMVEMQYGAINMLYFPVEKMQGKLGKDILDATSKCLYRSNNDGLEGCARGFWDFLKHGLTLILYLLLSARLSIFWLPILIIPSLLKERFKKGFYRLRESMKDEEYSKYIKSQYYERVALQNEAAKDLHLYHMIDLFRERQKELVGETLAFESKLEYRRLKYDLIGFLLFLLRDGLSLFILINALQNGLPIEEFVLYLSLLPAISNSISKALATLTVIKGNNPDLSYYRKVFSEPYYDEGEFDSELPDEIAEIKFENVSYSYDDEHPVIKNLNLTIKAGEKLALVGDNGAGKTTLAKLAAGMLTPDEGKITVGGVDLQKVNPKDRYLYSTLVFQEVLLVAMSAAENIACEKPGQIDEERLQKALEQADLKDFIDSLPKKSKTELTTYIHEDGVEMSGGQKQKLVLARALYKGGKVLLLDEPTSALDPLAEAELYRKYMQFTEDKTSIFISHRLSSTKICDRIVFLEDGQIKEDGTHQELMQEKGLYYTMFKTQAKYYQDEIEKEDEIEEKKEKEIEEEDK